jgi:tetratricopeptide (TPR) repeat protein
VWHRAAAAQRPDQEIAAALVAAADRAKDRGGLDVAFAALERAADLTADPALRSLRLAQAGNLANQLGRSADAVRLLRAALQLGRLPAHDAATASFDLETLTRARSGEATIRRFARIAEELADRGDGRRALDALGTVQVRAYWDQLDDPTRQHVSTFVARLAVPADDPQRLAALGLIDPIRQGREVILRVARLSPAGLPGPDEAMAVGRAAMAHLAVGQDRRPRRLRRLAGGRPRADGPSGSRPKGSRRRTHRELGRPAMLGFIDGRAR